MSVQWNEKVIQSIVQKMEKMKKELDNLPVNADNIAKILERLHPEVSPDTLHHGVQEIQAGIWQIYQAETEQMNESSAQILGKQMEGMTEEQKKGFLCQLFDSIKLSDEALDSEIENIKVDSTDLAQMSIEELQSLVSEQLVNTIKGMIGNVPEESMEEFTGMNTTCPRTEEETLLLATAQYSEALDGNISFEYTKVPRVLGQCAAAQTRITTYCDGIAQSEPTEGEKYNAIIEFIEGVLMVLAIVVFSTIFAIMIGEVAVTLMTVTFEAIAALLGTGIIAFIAELILTYPIMLVSFAAVIGAGAAIYFAGKKVHELFKSVMPKIQEFYNKLVIYLNGEKYNDEENYDCVDEDWDSQPDDLKAEDWEEEDKLAYT